MALSTAPRPPFPYLLLRRLTVGLAALVAGTNAYRHQYYLAGIWLVVSLVLLLSLAGHRLPPAGRKWALVLTALGLFVALALLVRYAWA